MSVFQLIKQECLTARKQKNKATAMLLITLLGELESHAKRTGTIVTDELVYSTCKKFITNNEATIAVASTEVKETLTIENETLSNFLPKQLDEKELREIINSLENPNIGLIMKHLKENYNGRYDGKMASTIAREL